MSALKEIEYPHALNLEVPGERRAPLEIRLMKLDYAKKMLDFMIKQ